MNGQKTDICGIRDLFVCEQDGTRAPASNESNDQMQRRRFVYDSRAHFPCSIARRGVNTSMNKTNLVIAAAVAWGLTSICSGQTTASSSSSAGGGSTAPYVEGPVWDVTMVRTKYGMDDDYLKALANVFKKTNDEAKKQGLIMDYKILIGAPANAQDYNILLMTEFKNMAALDGLRDKMDPLNEKLIGSEDVQRQGVVKRAEVREILGDKLMREVTLK
jgi:hypothetical protein